MDFNYLFYLSIIIFEFLVDHDDFVLVIQKLCIFNCNTFEYINFIFYNYIINMASIRVLNSNYFISIFFSFFFKFALSWMKIIFISLFLSLILFLITIQSKT